MTTSGEFQRIRDDIVEHSDCGYVGAAEIIDDKADRTIWWTCPGCGHPCNETYGDDLGASQAGFLLLFCLAIVSVALFGIGLMGRSWLPTILGFIGGAAFILIVLTPPRKDTQ